MDTWDAIEELARGALRGEEIRARKLLYYASDGLMTRAIRLRLMRGIRNAAVQQEVVQDILKSVWETRPQYPGDSLKRFDGWYYRICRSRIVDAMRKEERHERLAEMTHEMAQEFPARENDAPEPPDQHTVAALNRCLEKLRNEMPKLADVADLHYRGCYMIDLVKEILGRSRAAVYDQRERARKALKECLEHEGIDGLM